MLFHFQLQPLLGPPRLSDLEVKVQVYKLVVQGSVVGSVVEAVAFAMEAWVYATRVDSMVAQFAQVN